MSALVPILVAAGVGYVVVDSLDDDKPVARPSRPQTLPGSVSKFSPRFLAVVPATASKPNRNTTATFSGGGLPKNPIMVGSRGNGMFSQAARNASAAMAAQVGRAEVAVKAEYDKLSDSAKKKGAELLNQTYPGLNLTGKESFAEAGKKIGAVTGGALGAATGVPGAAWLGAVSGAYLGKKLGPWLGSQWDKVDDWAANAADSVKDYVSDKAGDAYGAVKDFLF